VSGAWYSERVTALGGVSGEGVREQLGRPRLSLFEVVTREAIQNSWDARTGETLRFEVAGWKASEDQANALERLLNPCIPPEPLPLAVSLRKRPLWLLAISDRGTKGLNGPTRADVVDPGGTHFTDFVFKVGKRAEARRAGTYGYGKSVFYKASTAQTVLAYTQAHYAAKLDTRLIGCAIGDDFQAIQHGSPTRYTGRHWWGLAEGDAVDPVRGADAHTAAESVGLKRFRRGETGTTLLLIDPAFDDPRYALETVASTILWHAWPKLVPSESGPAMSCAVSYEGEEIVIPDPRSTPPLDGFVDCLHRLQLGAGETVERSAPSGQVGRLLVERRLTRRRTSEPVVDPPVPTPAHHVALLRGPEFVVGYRAGPPIPSGAVEYFGVFRSADDLEVDAAFAAAEPPTHDRWEVSQLTGVPRKTVNAALSRVDERMKELTQPNASEIVGSTRIPLGAASTRFASLVATAPGLGADPVGDRGSGRGFTATRGPRDRAGSRNRAHRLEDAGDPEFGTFREQDAVFFPFRILSAPHGASVVANLGVGVDEVARAEARPPLGAEAPIQLGWRGPEGEDVLEGELAADGRKGELWRLAVRPAPDTVTVVSFGFREV
jgi:hypothetical protein